MSKSSTDAASPLKTSEQPATSSPEPVVKAAASRRKRALAERSEAAPPKAKSAAEAKPIGRKSPAAKAAKAAKPPKAEKSSAKSRVAAPKHAQAKGSEDKIKDRFTMPATDHALIAALKKRAKAAGRPVKKSELLRAGLHALNLLDETQLLQAVARLQPSR